MRTDEDLRYEVSDQIAEISLARLPVNALNLSLLEQLIAALGRAAGRRGDCLAAVMSGRPGSTRVRSTGVARKSPGPTDANGGHTR